MNALPKTEQKVVERRRHQRVKVALLGRYMLSDRHEYPCQSVDMSPGGVAVIAPVIGEIGERVVCYFDHIGRLEGVIVRQTENGFALCVNVPLGKREKIADQLTWLANRHSLGMPEDRRHERIVPRNNRTTLIAPGGQEYVARLQDISQSGAAVVTDAKLPLGAGVTVGKTFGRVVRTFATGVAVEFSRLIPVEEFNEDVTL
jgi:hypothetical protein